MAAGPDEVRGSGPNQFVAHGALETLRAYPIPGSTGSSSLLITLAFPSARTAQAIRAVLLASATDTSLAGLRSSSLAAQVLLALSCRAKRMTAVAPMTSRRRI